MAAEVPVERPLDPTKLMRIAAMVREILDEARRREPDPGHREPARRPLPANQSPARGCASRVPGRGAGVPEAGHPFRGRRHRRRGAGRLLRPDGLADRPVPGAAGILPGPDSTPAERGVVVGAGPDLHLGQEGGLPLEGVFHPDAQEILLTKILG